MDQMWYTHKLFWNLNVLFIIVLDTIFYVALDVPGQYKRNWAEVFVHVVELSISVGMVIMMLATKRRQHPTMSIDSYREESKENSINRS